MERRGGGFRFGFLVGLVCGAVSTYLLVARSEAGQQGSLASRAEQLRARARAQFDAVLAQGRQALAEGRQAAQDLRQEFEATLEAAQRE